MQKLELTPAQEWDEEREQKNMMNIFNISSRREGKVFKQCFRMLFYCDVTGKIPLIPLSLSFDFVCTMVKAVNEKKFFE